MSLYEAIAVEQCCLASIERYLLLLIIHAGHEAQGHPPGPQFFGIATTTTQVRQVVARVGVAQGSPFGVEDGVEAGYKHIRGMSITSESLTLPNTSPGEYS